MNAPIHPALLAEHQLRDLMLRVAEATRLDAAIAARGDQLSMARNGHRETASTRDMASKLVMAVDVNKLVAEFVMQAPDVTEREAFEAAANGVHFNTLRNQADGFVHPITWRAHTVWLAAVRWARNQREGPS